MICFNCGTQGQREDACPLHAPVPESGREPQQPSTEDEPIPTTTVEDTTYGAWMMVHKLRKKSTK